MAPRIDIVGGSALIVIAVASLLDARDLDLGSLRNFGPGMLPTFLAAALLACGIGLLGVGLFHRGALVEQFRAEWRGPAMIGLAILVFALTIEDTEIAGAIVVPQLGLALAGPLTVILTGYGTADADRRELAAIGFALTAACLAMFNDALTMDIPLLPRAVQNFLIDRIGAEVTLRCVYLLMAAIAFALIATRRRRVAT
jgi:hypothetical protein